MSYTSKKKRVCRYVGFYAIETADEEEKIAITTKINYHRFDMHFNNIYLKPELLSIDDNLILLDIHKHNETGEAYDDMIILKNKLVTMLGINKISINIKDVFITTSESEGESDEN